MRLKKNLNIIHQAFMRLYTRHMPQLRAYLRTLLPSWEDVDEVMQESSIVLWKKFDQFDQSTEFMAWATVVARYEVLKYRRKKSRDRHIFNDDLSELLTAEFNEKEDRLLEQRQALKTCIGKLGEKQRKMIVAVYSDGVKINQLAVELDRTATALYKALHRVRCNLLKCVRKEAGGAV